MIRILLVSVFFFSSCLAADELQCYVNASVSKADEPASTQTLETDPNLPIIIEADKTEVSKESAAKFIGDVSIRQGNNSIRANTANISSNRDRIIASGGIEFSNQFFQAHSDVLEADFNKSQLSLTKTKYQLDNFAGHGQAGVFLIDEKNQKLELSDATFTNCPPQAAPDWQLKSEKITLSMQDEWGEAWHSRIELFEVPVIYLPYLSFPLTDKRKSGWLYPSIETSTQSGLDVSAPYYWNISQQMDATFTPRLLSKRGLQLGTEYRYLTKNSEGEIYFEIMSSDSEFVADDIAGSGIQSRNAINWLHTAQLNEFWDTSVDLILISDDSYVSDLGFKDLNEVDTHVQRRVSFNRIDKNWDLSINLRDFEVFGSHSRPYRTLPEISLNYSGYTQPEGWSLELPAEFAWFHSEEKSLPNAIRLHTEPKLSWSIYRPAWELSIASSLASTAYHQQNITEVGEVDGYDTITRTLPRFRVNGRLILERPVDWFDKSMRQTLEPRFQYLRVGYKSQQNIGLYDSVLLQDDFIGLFRENRFSGIDRIPEANQLTLGVTTRLFNRFNREKLRLSIGQILYLKESRTDFSDFNFNDNEQLIQDINERGESALALELDLDIRKVWFLHYGLQFDAQQGETRKSQVTIDYRRDEDHLLQFSHRYLKNIANNGIQQLGLTSFWRINSQWQTFASFHQDLRLNRTVEAQAGLLYQSCCWELSLGWQTKVQSNLAANDSQTSVATDERDSGLMLSFTIRGFGQSSRAARKILNRGLFKYREPHFLNQ
ncbi:LPS-assembly protein LptD [Catenovulum maritimum]|uniref:LPS-assembly protein LptD n=1 Tax=Catenovulum maritimum TaxID=1513271 RepID=A0A0J8JNR8_9ALTE|nr:LPS assembly protein LptD [Catenovulum maritimum]KMT66271.1 hypothetical protein XM47_04575 [Catenovulum maritimum]